MRILVEPSNRVLAYRVYFVLDPSSSWKTIPRKIAVGEGVLLGRQKRASGLFLKHPVDAVYLGKEGTILHVLAPLRPWRLGPRIQSTQSILIIPAGEAQTIRLGERLRFAE